MKKVIISLMAIIFTCAFSSAEAKSENEKSLPPGLQKKVARGDKLPPGWQKKLVAGEHLDHQVYDHAEVIFPADNHGIITIEIEGKVVRLIEASLEIVDILK